MVKQIVEQLIIDGVYQEEREFTLSVFDVGFNNKISNLEFSSNKKGTVCFSGNRPMSLPWKYNEDCELYKEFRCRLKDIIIKLIDCGYQTFITGMAMGFDIICAEIILELKKSYKINLKCAVPCLNQTRGWKKDYIIRYNNILNFADSVYFTSDYSYFDGCYILRNKYMVDNSDLVLACQLKQSRGTQSTLNYAKSKNKKIILIK